MIPTAQQTQEVVAHFGSQRNAAGATGVARTTLIYWLRPELQRERSRRRYSENSAYRERKCKRMSERRGRLIYDGRCGNCGDGTLSEWYCWSCLSANAYGAVVAKARASGQTVEDYDPDAPLPENAPTFRPLGADE